MSDQRLAAPKKKPNFGSASFQQIMDAAVNADTAGDEQAARELVQMAQSMRDSATKKSPGKHDAETLAAMAKARRSQNAMDPKALAAAAKARRKPNSVVADTSFMGRLKDNVVGVDDGIMSPGEKFASALNIGGEGMTLGVVGDEAAAGFDSVLGRGTYQDRLAHHRQNETQLRKENPGIALGAEIAGALIGPGKGAASFINAGTSATAKVGRAAVASSGAGAVYGAAEGEGGVHNRLQNSGLAAATGLIGGGSLTVLGHGVSRAANKLLKSKTADDVLPALEQLKATANDLYAAAERAGGTIGAKKSEALSKSIERTLKSSGFHRKLHPRLAIAVKEISKRSGTEVSFQDAGVLRRIVQNAAQSLSPDERRLGSTVIDKIDNVIEGIGGGQEAKAAREVWSRMRRLETIEELIEQAADAPNFHKALQSKFRTLLRNKRKLRGFSKEEVAAIRKVARGNLPVQGLQAIGALFSPNSLLGMGVSAGATFAVGPQALALPAAGVASKAAANNLLKGYTKELQRTVVGGPRQVPSNPASGLTVLPGALGPNVGR